MQKRWQREDLQKKEAKNDPKRNVLLQCIGASERVKPDMFCGEVKKGDILLLCSDGFRHEISEKEMFGLLGRCESNKLNEMIKRLISLNLRRNEQDNISAALVKVQ